MTTGITCLKCGYQRTPSDDSPPTTCPQCGVVYSKIRLSPDSNHGNIERKINDKKPKNEEPKKPMNRLLRAALIGIAISIVLLFSMFTDDDYDPVTPYQPEWHTDVNVNIAKTLASNHVKCGEYKYKAAKSGSSEFIVHCSNNGIDFKAYIVFPQINKVTGPFSPGVSNE